MQPESTVQPIIPLGAVQLEITDTVAIVTIVVEGQAFEVTRLPFESPRLHAVHFAGLHAIIYGPGALDAPSEPFDNEDSPWLPPEEEHQQK